MVTATAPAGGSHGASHDGSDVSTQPVTSAASAASVTTSQARVRVPCETRSRRVGCWVRSGISGDVAVGPGTSGTSGCSSSGGRSAGVGDRVGAAAAGVPTGAG